MSESTSFAIATQQAHKVGKTPKGYGTAEGKREAKAKYDRPKADYKKTAEAAPLSFFAEVHEIFKVAAEDQIPGGKADNDTNDADFPKNQMELGEKVELEHTNSPVLAKEIARDHLTEFSDYYTRLKKMEQQAEASKEEKSKEAKVLTMQGRERIKEKNFAIPKGNGPGDTGKYPIHDETHARAALSMVGKNGTPAEKSKVYSAVAKKYPGLSERSSVPSVAEKAKHAMIPTTPTMMGASKNPAMASLAKAQKVGTPDDPNGPKYKALNQVKPATNTATSGTSTSSTSALKLGSVALDLFKKLAFSESSFSGGTFIFRPQYASGVRPVGENAGPASVMDPKLGGEQPSEKEKKAFSEAGFGATSQHGAWSGNGGRHASGLAWKDPGPSSVMDPKLGGESPPEKYKRALMLKEGSDPGAVRTTAPPGPSIAQVSKPKGYGRPVSGALKNRI